MNFLHLEGDVLINLDLIDKVEFLHNEKKAVLRAGGLFVIESAIAYRYFTHPDTTSKFIEVPTN